MAQSMSMVLVEASISYRNGKNQRQDGLQFVYVMGR